VEYSLSELGKSLESVLLAMHEWGEKNASKRVLALSMDDVLID
jgi:DNA-binding HxlR family transcriptional regulator